MRGRSITLRLALTYTVTFAVAIALLGVIVIVGARATLERQFETRIGAEAAALAAEFKTEGLDEVAHAVHDRDLTPGAIYYGLRDAQGRRVQGRLAEVQAQLGWSTITMRTDRGPKTAIRVLTVTLPDGHVLLVGDELADIQSLDGILVSGFALLILLLIVFGGVSGYILSRGVRRRFAAINAVAERISEGDLQQRAVIGRNNDDLDQLALTFNHMLDRLGALLESLRQVSNDVAHDLRTPLTRLRQRLEGALGIKDEAARTAAIEDAIADLDAALDTFAAMLRIAEIESGGRRAGFSRVNLRAIARHVAESFAPSAEEDGRRLLLADGADVEIVGDAELLTQMIVNLVENGLRHTPVGATVRISVTGSDEFVALKVTDNGPGIPVAERGQVFKRFYRLEESRSTPGSGLGLSLVSAVAKLHDASATLDDAYPGLEISVVFRRASHRETLATTPPYQPSGTMER